MARPSVGGSEGHSPRSRSALSPDGELPRLPQRAENTRRRGSCRWTLHRHPHRRFPGPNQFRFCIEVPCSTMYSYWYSFDPDHLRPVSGSSAVVLEHRCPHKLAFASCYISFCWAIHYCHHCFHVGPCDIRCCMFGIGSYIYYHRYCMQAERTQKF